MSEAGKNRRDRAAAARDSANADERRRERLVRIIGALTVVVVVVGIIAVAVVARNSSSSQTATAPAVDPSAPLPKGVLPADDDRRYGVPYGTAGSDAPVLEIWEDFQCPACAAVEQANGAGIEALADSGTVQLIWRPATFLDRVNEAGSATVANSSSRAAAAWGCAIDAGKAKEFHNLVFANQPTNEGDGYTDEQLIGFGTQAGISGADLDTFTTCVADGTYLGWAANSGAAFQEDGVQGTPFALLDGVEVPSQTLADKAALEQFIADAAAGAGNDASAPASPSPAAS